MKNKWIYIALVIITAFAVWSFMSSHNTKKNLKEILAKHEQEVKANNKKNDSIDTVIWDLRDIVNADSVVIKDLEEDQNEAVEEASTYKKKYLVLLNRKPETIEGKYELEKEKVVVLLDENKSLDNALVLCDSAKTVYRVTINNLEQIIINKDFIIANKDNIIRVKNKQLSLVKEEGIKTKRKSWLKGAGVGVLVGIGAALILSN